MTRGGKEKAGNLCPDDVLGQEHQVLVLQFCRSPEESEDPSGQSSQPLMWWGNETPTGF